MLVVFLLAAPCPCSNVMRRSLLQPQRVAAGAFKKSMAGFNPSLMPEDSNEVNFVPFLGLTPEPEEA